MSKRDARERKGLSVDQFIFPLSVVLGILLAIIIVLFLLVNDSSNKLSELMHKNEVCTLDATALEVDMNVLATTIDNFVKNPLKSNGEVNKGPLGAYARQLRDEEHAAQIAERFRTYDVRAEAIEHMDSAAAAAEKMQEMQAHVIALVRSVYPLPQIEELSGLPDEPLTEEELALSDEERIAEARKLLVSKLYAPLRTTVSADIADCKQILQADFSADSAKQREGFHAFRTALWTVIVLIAILLMFTFVLFYRWLFVPLRNFARRITDDQPMEQVNTFREMQLVVNAYNGLLTRRRKLEDILRSAAETDALTGLPNRYSMENYALKVGDEGGSMAVVAFDLNNLKRVNDGQGHLAGDELIKTAGSCICACFATAEQNNCFRIGGDEFTAILTDCSEKDVQDRIAQFRDTLTRESISISCGYAFEESTDADSFISLLELADQRMYDQKKLDHAAAAAAEGQEGPDDLAR